MKAKFLFDLEAFLNTRYGCYKVIYDKNTEISIFRANFKPDNKVDLFLNDGALNGTILDVPLNLVEIDE